MLSCFSCVWLIAALWTVARQAALSMEFSRQEYWSGWPCLPPGDLPDPGIKHQSTASPALQADSLPLNHWGSLIGGWLFSNLFESVNAWVTCMQSHRHSTSFSALIWVMELSCRTRGSCSFQGTFGNLRKHFWFSKLRRVKHSWHLVGGCQGCCQTPCSV